MLDNTKEIDKAKKRGDYLRAGDLYLMVENFQDAIDMYIKGKHYVHAARVLEKHDSWAPAAKYYSLAGDYVAAARMFVKLKNFHSAAQMFERAEDFAKACEMYYRADKILKAAVVAQKGGMLERAALLYEKSEQFETAADLHYQLMKRAAADAAHGEGLESHRIAIRKHGNAAGALFVRIQNFDRASECFLKAENTSKAAEVWKVAGNYQRAAKLYLSVGDHKNASIMQEMSGKLNEASELAEEAGNLERAASLAEKAGSPARAAELLAKAGKAAPAAELYFQLLIECFQKENATAALKQSLRKYGIEAGALYQRLRNFSKAGWCYEQSHQFARAAECYVQGKLYEKAAEMYFQTKEFERAWELLSKAGEVQNKELLADVAFCVGRYSEAGDLYSLINQGAKAARSYEKSDQRHKAAILFEDLGETSRAAAIYESVGESEKAAKLFEKAQEFKKASKLYEKLGRFEEAAHCSMKADERLRTAQLLIKNGKEEDAIPVLQAIPRDSVEFRESSLLLGSLFVQVGMYPLAVQRISEGLAQDPVSKENLASYYDLAAAVEQTGDLAGANELFRQILAVQYDYKDVKERVQSYRPTEMQISGDTRKMKESAASINVEAATPVMELKRGKHIREYEILEMIGAGGMATVYRARHRYLKEERALKIIRSKLAGSEFAQRFVQEAKILSRLRHPNLVQLYEFGTLENGSFFMVLELIRGESVRAHALRESSMLPGKAAKIIQQAAQGLRAAHAHGIIHRDISPDNLMLVLNNENEETTKVIDFGVAKMLLDQTWGYTSTGSFMGKPEFASPEQCGFLKKNEVIDERSDVYSLGVTFYYLLTGKLPFSATSPQGYLVKHLTQKPRPLNEVMTNCPDILNQTVMRAMADRREDRHESMQELIGDLDKIRMALLA